MDTPSTSNILEALNKSGYLMEQEVATSFENIGFNVRTNVSFQDNEEGKSREIDILATKQLLLDESTKKIISLIFICECKNSSNPYVFLLRDKNKFDNHVPNEYYFSKPEFFKKHKDGIYESVSLYPAFYHLDLDKSHHYYKNRYKAVQFCQIIREGKDWKAKHENIYDSLILPLVKAFISKKHEIVQSFSSPDWTKIFLFFPCIVTNSKINELHINSPDVLNEVTFSTYVRELSSEKIKGKFMIDFINKDCINEYYNTNIVPFSEKVTSCIDRFDNLYF